MKYRRSARESVSIIFKCNPSGDCEEAEDQMDISFNPQTFLVLSRSSSRTNENL